VEVAVTVGVKVKIAVDVGVKVITGGVFVMVDE
jgi:hypothetical protein